MAKFVEFLVLKNEAVEYYAEDEADANKYVKDIEMYDVDTYDTFRIVKTVKSFTVRRKMFEDKE